MARRSGFVQIEYEGRIPTALKEHLESTRVKIAGLRPLTLLAGRPEVLLNQILRYLGDEEMRVRRVVLRSGQAA